MDVTHVTSSYANVFGAKEVFYMRKLPQYNVLGWRHWDVMWKRFIQLKRQQVGRENSWSLEIIEVDNKEPLQTT